MQSLEPTTSRLVKNAQAWIEFEEDPHQVAIEDNPDEIHVSASTWAAIFFLAISFGPPIGLGFLAIAAVVVQVTTALGDEAGYAWVIGSWSLGSAVSFSLAGPLSDVFGRRNPILVGEGLILIGCIIAAVAQDVPMLIAGEALLGLGSGVVFVAYAGVPEMLPNKWRSVGFGLLEAGVLVPWGMVSSLLGNALLEYATWRWIYYLAIMVEIVAMIGTAVFYRPVSRPRGDYDKSRWDEFKEIDFMGLFLVASGLTVFIIGLTWGGSSSHPWSSAGTLVPIILGFLVLLGDFAYDTTVAQSPTFPRNLFARVRQYNLLLIVLFITGMTFCSMAALLPQVSLYLFETNGIQIGLMSLPNNIMLGIAGVAAPLVAHKIGYVKWQLVFALVLQAIFITATAGTVYPDHKFEYMFVSAFGTPMFVWVIILSYAIASLHVPHSQLGVAMGLLGTFRSAGGSVGNAIFDTIFADRFQAYSTSEITKAALEAGLRLQDLAQIIPATIEYNIGILDTFDNIAEVTPVIADLLRTAIRNAYGHAFKIVFYSTLPFSVLAVICALFVEDPTPFMTNHVQSSMQKERDLKQHNEGSIGMEQPRKLDEKDVVTHPEELG